MHGKLAQKCISLKHPIVSLGLQLQGSSREPGRGRLWGDPGGQGEEVGKGATRLPASALRIPQSQRGTAGEGLGALGTNSLVSQSGKLRPREGVTMAEWVPAGSRERAASSLLDSFICSHCVVHAGREGALGPQG